MKIGESSQDKISDQGGLSWQETSEEYFVATLSCEVSEVNIDKMAFGQDNMTMTSFATIAITLFLAMDALGVIPVYLSYVKKFEQRKSRLIALREMGIALVIMILFFFLGPLLLSLLSLNETTTQIAGGIVIFLIAVNLIFRGEDTPLYGKWEGNSDFFIVPIATPLIAGPSVLAVIMIYSQEEKSMGKVLGAIFLAWFVSCLIFLFARHIYKLLTEKGLMAAQRLMGLIIGVIAIHMFIQGVKGLIP